MVKFYQLNLFKIKELLIFSVAMFIRCLKIKIVIVCKAVTSSAGLAFPHERTLEEMCNYINV